MTWESIKSFEDIKYERGIDSAEGIAKITINRPEVRNAFRPKTVFELKEAFTLARDDQSIGVIILTWPISAVFYATGSDELAGFASFGVVGIGYVGGAAWGFSSGHSSFAWGVLASLIIIPGLIFGLVFGFCMLMISTGNGF